MTYLIYLIILLISFYLIGKYRIRGLIFLIIFMLPFRMEVFSLNGIGIRITDILSSFYIIIWSVKWLLGHMKKYDIKLTSPILLFLMLVILSFLMNALRYSSLANMVDLIRLILAILTGIAIATSIKGKPSFITLLKTWSVSATLSSAISIYFFFSKGNGIATLFNMNDLSVVEFYSIKFSNSIFFEDPNNLASYLLISIFITVGLSVDKHINFKFKYIHLLVQLLGLVLTLSRSSFMACGMAILIFLFAYKITNYKWIIPKVITIFMVLVYAVLFIESLDSDVSVLSRIGLWDVGLNMTLANPFLGVGIGNSSNVFNQYIDTSLILYNPHFHNLFLTISSEIGLVGFISFISIFFKDLYKWIHSNDKLYLFLCLGLISYLIQSFGVEYFASRHFWIFLPLLIFYRSKSCFQWRNA